MRKKSEHSAEFLQHMEELARRTVTTEITEGVPDAGGACIASANDVVNLATTIRRREARLAIGISRPWEDMAALSDSRHHEQQTQQQGDARAQRT